MSETAQDLVRAVRTVYSLPATFHRLTEVVDNPDSCMDDIAEVVSGDQSLAARLLALSNSAFYGFPSRVETISHAVTMIGAQQLRDLVQGTLVIKIFDGIPVELVDMESFWRHSIACGIATRLLATHRREPNTERFFVVGLLHDIGRLVIFQQLSHRAVEVMRGAREREELVYAVEREELGFDHADVGYALLAGWQLPARLLEAVKLHHRFSSSAARFPVECAMVHVADVIVHSMEIGCSGEVFVPPINPQAWDVLDMGTDVLMPLCREVERQFDEVAKVFLPRR
jgi:HD-like signal output (HDOD) protein